MSVKGVELKGKFQSERHAQNVPGLHKDRQSGRRRMWQEKRDRDG